MIRSILWALAILGLVLLLQTTVFSYLAFAGAKVQVLLLVFVLLATQNGSLISQIVGFVLGLVVDSVTGSPFGFHAFLYALGGYLFGLGSGKVYFDPLIMPAFLGVLATLYESVGGYLLNEIFQLGQPISAFFHFGLIFQAVLNALLMPLSFSLYGWIRERFHNPRRGFGG